ncbi:MAG: SDR family oxidoreductase [Cyanobacteriota bacterium]|nr:SDR family oxidoreductase [Cyanobacteriota bacterium]
MNAAIIGCGYVGRAVARLWSQDLGLAVTTTTTTPENVPALEAISSRAEVLSGGDRNALKSILKDREVALFCMSPRSTSYEDAYLKTAISLAEVAPELPNLKQVIYTSSYGIYGNRNGEEVTEETPVSPMNSNGEILARTENVFLSAANKNLKVCILRLGGIYGPDRELIKIFRRSAGQTRPGSGQGITNWIHLDDIVGVTEFSRKQQLDGIYNVVDGLHLTRKELLDRVMEKHELSPVTWDASQSVERANVKVSNQKLKDAGYSFVYPTLCDTDT